ncbi:MAG: hypothetical protein FWD71_01190 [Oscillospiraceae bacterium]|nr:hypothetical protein [Oscillospiraceae bacterium]
MNIKEIIAKEEQEFPGLFAFSEERPYGILFFNPNIKDHHDSNHAIIYPEKIIDLGDVLDNIREFYQARGIVPALYHPNAEDYFIQNARTLKAHGYEFMTALDARIMVLENTDIKPLSGKLQIKQIKELGAIKEGSYFIEQDKYLSEIYRNCINKESHYLFTGFYEDKPVSLLSFHVSKYGCTRFDEMHTAKAYMGNGFAREMNKYAANFCVEHNLPTAYQWPAHRTSERITSEAGFKVSFTLPIGGYAAYAIVEHYRD